MHQYTLLCIISSFIANLQTVINLFQDAFSENAQHLQKVLMAYLSKRGKSDPACAVSDNLSYMYMYITHGIFTH